MDETSAIQRIAIWALPVLLAITVHEVAHGWVALRLGDRTAQMLGRLTLNPIKHIDPVGTLLVPGLLLLIGGFVFGWAKPVPVTWDNLRNPKRDMAIVAAAGPLSNFIMAVMWAILLKVGVSVGASWSWFSQPLVMMAQAGITINLILMVLNLVPIPPLDGGRIAVGMLPGPWAWRVSRIEPYGMFIVLGLLVTGVLSWLMSGPIQVLRKAILMLAGFH